MGDVRNRLRSPLHSGVAYKVAQVVGELIELDDPELYDWVLQAAYVRDAARSQAWLWKYDDVQKLVHPSLTTQAALTILSRARTAMAMELRRQLTGLCIELGFNDRNAPHMDVSMLGGMTEVTKLRLMPCDPPSQWNWRDQLMGKSRPLLGFESIADMTALEHLTVIGGARVDLGILTAVRSLRAIELVACHVENAAGLPELSATDITISHCHGIATIDALPPGAMHVHLEMLPELTSVGTWGGADLKNVTLLGAPGLSAPPQVTGDVALEFSVDAPLRTGF